MILYKSPAGAVAAPFCLTTFLSPLASSFSLPLSSFSLFLSLRSHLRDSSQDSQRVRAPRALRRSLEARDRRSYRWQRDSFVLSRRFQLIFIVYLPDQRYLEDNGPPRYIRSEPYHANTEVYLLSSLASGQRGSLLSPHPRLICRRRIA